MAFGVFPGNLGQHQGAAFSARTCASLPDLIAGNVPFSLVGEAEILHAQLASRFMEANGQSRFADGDATHPTPHRRLRAAPEILALATARSCGSASSMKSISRWRRSSSMDVRLARLKPPTSAGQILHTRHPIRNQQHGRYCGCDPVRLLNQRGHVVVVDAGHQKELPEPPR